ncbi:MAG TPA: hypothetical protein PKD47_07685, partial [Solirubrobacterales bacterium]|nr:hypothetical protein [Solirubrobacterales bacterium]
MAKSRAQRKAERRAREAAAQGGVESDSQAQHDTQVPKSGDIAEIEAVEAGIAAGAREEDLETPDAPKGKQELSSKEEKRKARQEEKRKKSEQKKQEEQQLAKRQKQAQGERKRGGV